MDKKTEDVMRSLITKDTTVEETLNKLKILPCELLEYLLECAISVKLESLNADAINFMRTNEYTNLRKKVIHGGEKTVSKLITYGESIRFFSELAFHAELASVAKQKNTKPESYVMQPRVSESESEIMHFEIHGQNFTIVKNVTKHKDIDKHTLRLSLEGIIIHSENWNIDKKN